MTLRLYGECINCKEEFCGECKLFQEREIVYSTNQNKEDDMAYVGLNRDSNGILKIGKVIGPIKSDGGSSSYYDFIIPRLGTIKTEELIKYFVDNDFDLGTILKTLRRVNETKKGVGKEGNDILYELNKIKYTIDKLIEEYS